jgi:predicted amidophosphoribosyltransferase
VAKAKRETGAVAGAKLPHDVQNNPLKAETIGQRLDRLHGPPLCDICKTPVPRASKSWPICPRCGHSMVGIEAALIHKVQRTIRQEREIPNAETDA